MAAVTWGDPGNRIFETGVDRGVLYVGDYPAVPWDGIVSISESSSGGDLTAYYLDGEKYITMSKDKNFTIKLEAYTSPPEFDECDGMVFLRNGLFSTMQPRKEFGLSYRTLVGNDLDGLDLGYKIHLVYGAMAVPTGRTNKTLTGKVDPMALTWEITSTRQNVSGFKPTAHLVIDSTKAYDWAIAALEKILYGTADQDGRLPLPDEVVQLFEDNSILKITDNGDGTWTASGPDSVVSMLDANTFQISWPSLVFTDAGQTTYDVTSL